MKIYIENRIKTKSLTLNLMDNNYYVVDRINLNLIFNEININLDKYKFLSIDFDNSKSETVILSKNLSHLVLEYNEKTKTKDIYLKHHNIHDYGCVETIKLKDEKNLFFREDKEKTINILLPNEYNPNKKYGLIIMFDSQNIYDLKKVGNYTSKNDPYGGWQVETSLSTVKELSDKEYIVVGIENADKYREIELTPSTKMGKFKEILLDLHEENLLKGELDHFGDFINETVIPYICENYSVDLNEVGIVGSSCGGLASFYLGLRDYDKYRFIFTFTPATGFIEDETLKKFYRNIDFKQNKDKLPYIFFYQGNKGDLESLLYILNSNFVPLLINEGYPNKLIDQYIEESAEHNETMWRYGFNYAIMKYIEKRG